ncbi:oligosaccharide flippase family protein [Moheibacter sp.]|uniref:oligosaccharide flippase family protein n=1 Tax=Moheibacter sp. TaxID=1965316 RepID=UPI003C76FDCA
MRINRKQFQTKNFKGVLSLLAGNTISKVIVTIGGMILANYYGPESYGFYNVFLSYVLILPVLSGLRLDNIMILQRGSKEVRNLFSGIIVISFLLSFLMITVMAVMKLLNVFSFQMSYFLLFLTGLGSILTAWNLTQNNMFTKYKLFKQISTAFVISSVFSVVFQTIFYFIGLTDNGLIYGWILGLIASFLYNLRVSKGQIIKVNIPMFRQSVKEHIEIVKFTYPSDSLNAIANNILPILVIFYFTSAEVGLYGMAFKILSVPLVLLSGSVSRVYFQKAVSLNHSNKKSLEKLTYKVIVSNVAIIFVFVIFMNTLGIYLLDLFLKDAWDGVGAYVLALSFWILARSAMNPIAPLVVVLKKNHYSLIFNIYLLLSNLIAIYLGVLKNDFLYCVWIFSILSGIGYLVLLGMVLYNLKKNVKVSES